MKKHLRGTTLIELLMYAALLSTVLFLVYDFFVQVNLGTISASANSEIYLNAQRVILDLKQTIQRSQDIDYPVFGNSGASLSLNNGSIIYEVDDLGRLERKETGETNVLTNGEVMVESLIFEILGPSLIQSTVRINLTLKATQKTGEPDKKETFYTSVTLR